MTDQGDGSDFSSGERIAKYLASAGIASRRDVEKLIAAGRVVVNGRVLDTPAFKVTGAEAILVDGKPVRSPEATRLWRYHKPVGLVTTNRDPEGRATIFENLPPHLPRVVTIGRLDLNTEGLLLLTNDGELARALELPATGLERRYRARAFGTVTQKELDRLRDGIVHEGVEYRSIIARLDRTTGSNTWIDLTLTEGKKREARRALESLGMKVNRLIRTSYGPMELEDMAVGEVQEVPAADLLAAFGPMIPEARRPSLKALRPAKGQGHTPAPRTRAAERVRKAKPQRSTNLDDDWFTVDGRPAQRQTPAARPAPAGKPTRGRTASVAAPDRKPAARRPTGGKPKSGHSPGREPPRRGR